MGVFDYIRCNYPMPDGVPNRRYQTKDTPSQFMDEYEISADGRLIGPAAGSNDRFTGEVRFYGFHDDVAGEGWIELSAYFVRGQIRHLELIENNAQDEPNG